MRTFTLYFWLILTWPLARVAANVMTFSCAAAEEFETAGLKDKARVWVLRAHSAIDGDFMRLYLACKLRVLRRQGRRKLVRQLVADHREFVIELSRIAQQLST